LEDQSGRIEERPSGILLRRGLFFYIYPYFTQTQCLSQLTKMIHPLTVLPVSSRQRISQIHYHPTAAFLAIQSHDRSIDVFRIRTEDEVQKKRARRQRRIKEKKSQKGTTADEDMFGNEDAEIQLVDLYTPYLVVRASGKIRSFNFVVNDLHAKATQVSSYQHILAIFFSHILAFHCAFK
jgi:hypothetical protein